MMSTLPQNVIIHVDYSMQSENVVKCKHYENVQSSATFCSRGTRARMPQGPSLPDWPPRGNWLGHGVHWTVSVQKETHPSWLSVNSFKGKLQKLKSL